MKKLNISMLSMDEPASPEAVNLDDGFEDTTNEVQGGLDSLNIAMTDLEAIDDAIDEAIEVSSELHVEQEVVEQAQQQGQISQAALESIQRSVSRLVKSVGYTEPVTFAMEAYNNPHYNKPAMESAIDSIKAFVKRIWDAVVAAFDKTKDMVKNLLKNYFDLSVKIKKRVAAVKQKAEGLKGKTVPSDYMVSNSNLTTYMRVSNKAITPTGIVANIDKWTAYSHNVIEGIAGNDAIDEYKQFVEQYNKLLEEALKHQNKDKLQAQADALGKSMMKRIYKELPNPLGTKHATNVLLGDVRYVFDDSNKNFEVAKEDGYKELPTERTHEPLTVDQVITLCDKIDKHMDTYKNIDSYINNLDKLKNSIDQLAKDAIKSNKEVDYVQSKLITNLSSFTIKLFIKAIGRVGIGARRHDMNVDNAIVDWCALSLKPL